MDKDNNNFGKNVMGGLLGAVYLMCFAFPVGLVMNVFMDKMPIGQFLGNEILIFLAVWFIGYFITQGYREMLANANKPREPEDKQNQNETHPTDANPTDTAGNKTKGAEQNSKASKD